MLKLFRLFDEDSYNLDLIISNRTLSSGQMQKISFIRSLLSNTELLLLDESTSNLDSQTRDLIFNILKSKNITILILLIIMKSLIMITTLKLNTSKTPEYL